MCEGIGAPSLSRPLSLFLSSPRRCTFPPRSGLLPRVGTLIAFLLFHFQHVLHHRYTARPKPAASVALPSVGRSTRGRRLLQIRLNPHRHRSRHRPALPPTVAGPHSPTMAPRPLMDRQRSAGALLRRRGRGSSSARSRHHTSSRRVGSSRKCAYVLTCPPLMNTLDTSCDLLSQTISVTIHGVAQHLISYYSVEDAKSGRLRSPSTLPELSALEISPDYVRQPLHSSASSISRG